MCNVYIAFCRYNRNILDFQKKKRSFTSPLTMSLIFLMCGFSAKKKENKSHKKNDDSNLCDILRVYKLE